MRIVLTGAHGFIGNAIGTHLREHTDWNVVGIDLTPSMCRQQNEEYYQCDLAVEDEVRTISKQIGQADVIVHTAAKVSFDNLDASILQTNIMGVFNCISMAHQLHCRQIVFLGSVPIIGEPQVSPVTESNHEYHPQTLYHLTKWMGEKLLNLPCFDIPNICTLRIPAPIGPKMPLLRMIPLFMANAISGVPLVVHGTGGRIQTYIDVRDIAEAVRLAILHSAKGCYIVGGHAKSNREVAECCKAAARSSSEILCSGKEDMEEGHRWILDSSKIEMDLGFKPSIKFEETLSEMATYMAAQNKDL